MYVTDGPLITYQKQDKDLHPAHKQLIDPIVVCWMNKKGREIGEERERERG